MIVVGVPATFTYRDDVALTCVITNNFVMDWMIEVEVGGGSGSDMISCGGFGCFSSLSTKKRL